jgi:tetratricopeptide (TPR) repeat protein
MVLGYALLFLAPESLSAAASARTHAVQQILRDGKPVDSASGFTLSHAGIVEHTLRRDETILDGTRIDVPARLTVIIVSSGLKSMATLQPGSSVTFVSTGSGELVSNNAGHVIFHVVTGALDFFRVQSGEAITASVHGTVFWMDESKGAVTVSCKSGEVNITKTGYVLIAGKRLKASLIDVLSATKTPRVTYRASATWYLGSFASYPHAEMFYQQQLTAAQQSGDANATGVAFRNLGIIQTLGGQYADALQSHERALAISRTLGDRDGEASALADIGSVERDQSRNEDSLQSYHQAVAIFHTLGDRGGEAQVLSKIGALDEKQGKYADAIRSYGQTLKIFQQLGDTPQAEDAIIGIKRVKGAITASPSPGVPSRPPPLPQPPSPVPSNNAG